MQSGLRTSTFKQWSSKCDYRACIRIRHVLLHHVIPSPTPDLLNQKWTAPILQTPQGTHIVTKVGGSLPQTSSIPAWWSLNFHKEIWVFCPEEDWVLIPVKVQIPWHNLSDTLGEKSKMKNNLYSTCFLNIIKSNICMDMFMYGQNISGRVQIKRCFWNGTGWFLREGLLIICTMCI